MAIKQRYTVTVAGYEMSVRSDDAPEDVEEIVGALDRSIRGLCARNRTLPRNEAIILCALDAYSEKKQAERHVRELERELYGSDGKYARLERENELLRAYIERRTPARAEQPDDSAKDPSGPENGGERD